MLFVCLCMLCRWFVHCIHASRTKHVDA